MRAPWAISEPGRFQFCAETTQTPHFSPVLGIQQLLCPCALSVKSMLLPEYLCWTQEGSTAALSISVGLRMDF